MPVIRQLPPNLINQIAAGEVIERPASVVKELLENSIDAGARRVEVTIEKGGLELIRISDDGCGMSADQLPLAVTSHATSKLPDDDTLFKVQTLGFRGEALASIGSVSHLTIRSRTTDSDSGSELEVRGGHLEGPAPCGCPVGTVMEIRNLFFNTPVRRKFLRTPQTEMGHIVEAFTRLALAYPSVHMTLLSGGRTLYDLPATTFWAERISAFFGGEIADSLIAVDSDDGQVKISGYACDPSVHRGHTRMQYLILNGRHIRDRALQHSLSEAYRGLLMSGRHPVCFLKLQMPPDLVDVNVHPTKLEVRFADSGRIYARLLQTLRQKFLSTDLTVRIGQNDSGSPDQTGEQPASSTAAPSQLRSERLMPSELGMAPSVERAQRQSVIEWARGGSIPEFKPFGDPSAIQPVPGALPRPFPTPPTTNDQEADQTASVAPWDLGSDAPPGAEIWSGQSESTTIDPTIPHGAPLGDTLSATAGTAPAPDAQRFDSGHGTGTPSMSHLGYQVHDRYLVTQDERGMVIVDQHALHERILYERIREKVLGGSLETQRLLVPEPVSLVPSEMAAALEAKELLAKVGIEIEAFGGDSLLVSSYPAMLSKMAPSEMLR